jgi:hypothetical protein
MFTIIFNEISLFVWIRQIGSANDLFFHFSRGTTQLPFSMFFFFEWKYWIMNEVFLLLRDVGGSWWKEKTGEILNILNFQTVSLSFSITKICSKNATRSRFPSQPQNNYQKHKTCGFHHLMSNPTQITNGKCDKYIIWNKIPKRKWQIRANIFH